MKINDVLHGFQIVSKRESAELNGTLWEMRHVKTGAQLVWLDNGESNMVFSVAFKTLPWDDTGVFHILEHSVLCGSEHFPVKEPFVDLLKSSMNTFLNAMTFSDKTVYPVSSRNEQDYLNLTRVYLDAVFCPAIYKNPGIFYQEGWHYELTDADAQPVYKGVVFNEMKGSMSSVDNQAIHGIERILFPDTCYGYVSGGDPKHIPELTYEQFLQAHRTFYHPTNAKIYLDGAVPLDKVLCLISEQYLDHYEHSDASHEIAVQEPVKACSAVQYYEIGKEEDTARKSVLVMGKLIGSWDDRKKITALSLLGDYLAGSNEAPLKRAILESGLAQDMALYVDDNIFQPNYILLIRNTDYEHRESLRGIIGDTVRRILAEGLEKEELSAILNQFAFAVKETREPKGIERNINALTSWLHGGDPLLYLENDALIADLREAIDTDYYEKLLEEALLDDEHIVDLCMLPSKTKGDEDRAVEQQRLADARASWDEQKIQEILELNASLEKWQCSVDTPEALATLPMLSLSDVSETPEWVETVLSEVNGVTVLHHPLATNGVVHASLRFGVSDLSVEELQKLSLLTRFLGELPTAKHTVTRLQRLLKKYVGPLNFGLQSVPNMEDPTVCKPYFTVSFSVLENYLKEACELVCEILLETDYTSDTQIRELLLQNIEGYSRSFVRAGNRYAVQRALSNFSACAYLEEKLSGYDFHRMQTAFSENFDTAVCEFRAFVQNAAQNIFGTHRLTVSETSPVPHTELHAMIEALQNSALAPQSAEMKIALSVSPAKEAILIPSGVSYAAFCGELHHYGKAFDSSLHVLSTILSFGYLWNEIRVRGGAYGCGFRARESGGLSFHSYRDPSPMRSLQIYRDTASFIRSFVESDEPIEKYIISTIASMEPLMTPSQRGSAADTNYLCGIGYEDKLRIRKRLLQLKKEDLLAVCDLFDEMANGNAICIVGSEGALSELDDSWTVYTL